MIRILSFVSCVFLSMPLWADVPKLVQTFKQWRGQRVAYLVQSAPDSVLRRVQNQVNGKTRVQELVVSGSAAKNAGIVRARWRPAAIHTQYASSTCPTTKMRVFETQSVAPVSSYSPITTRFGYYGTIDCPNFASETSNPALVTSTACWSQTSKASHGPMEPGASKRKVLPGRT